MSPTALALAHPAQNQPIWFQECRVGIAMEITMAGGAVEGIIMVISPHNVGIGIYNIYIYTGWWFQSLWQIWKSVGMILPNIWRKNMFQTINQYIYIMVRGGNWALVFANILYNHIYIYNPYNYGCSCISIYNWNCTSKHPNPLT